MTGRVFAVASGKGGVGKTTTAVNLAAAMAEADRSVVLVDYDLGMANIGAVLDIEEVETTLHDVLAGEAETQDAVSPAPGGFDVMLGGTTIEDFGRADPSELRDVVEDLRDTYDVTIVDTGGGLSHDTTVPLGLADDVLLVSTPQVAAIKNTEKTLQLARRVGGDVKGLILTRLGTGGVDAEEAVDDLDVPLLGKIPEDNEVAASETAGEPLVAYAPESPAAQSYRELGYELLGESLPLSFQEDDDGESASAGAALAEVMDEDEAQKPSLVARLTGGLLGSKKNN